MNRLIAALLLLLSPNLHAEEVTLSHNGLSLRANLEQAGDNWTDGPVVLMTHGTLAHNRMEIMATLQALMKERGISSLALTLSLGLSDRQGMYDCAVPHTHKHTDALNEIGLWLDWLKGKGVKHVVLLGHSRGGNQTAWFAAEKDQAAISCLVLVAPSVWSEKKAQTEYQKSYGKPLAPVLAKAEKLVRQGKGTAIMEQVDFIYCPQTRVTAEAVVSYYRPDTRMDTPTLLTQIDKPVLVIIGSEDTVVEGLKQEMAKVGKDNVNYEVIDGADHYFRDLYAEELVDVAEGFIKGK